MSLVLLSAISLTLLIVYRGFQSRRQRRGLPLPPGPPGEPIIGHLRKIPKADEEDVLLQWHKQYGDVVHVNVFGQSIILLNTKEAATDLLENRARTYSDRPFLPLMDMVGWKGILTTMPYGQLFHKTRKMLQDTLPRQSSAGMFNSIQLREAQILLKNLLETPEDFGTHIDRYTSAVIMEITYGYRILSNDDPYIERTKQIRSVTTRHGDIAVSIVDFLPFLRHLPLWVPGTKVMNFARESFPVLNRIKATPFEEVQRNMADGTAAKCFVSTNLDAIREQGLDSKEEMEQIEHLRTSAFMLYVGGSETTWATIENFILAMLLHPEAQRKAQKEIDEVLKQERLPEYSDRESIPYVEYAVQESMRWHPTLIFGIPHRVMEDDTYNGMFIPKGATVIGNQRCFTMDENTYQDPMAFRPERFIPSPNKEAEPYPSRVFGFGRRICPGRFLADGNLWIVAANILAAFEILPAKDKNGVDIMPKPEYNSAITSHPKEFKCLIRPRSEKLRRLIEDL